VREAPPKSDAFVYWNSSRLRPERDPALPFEMLRRSARAFPCPMEKNAVRTWRRNKKVVTTFSAATEEFLFATKRRGLSA
jgi:hypothetical protein